MSFLSNLFARLLHGKPAQVSLEETSDVSDAIEDVEPKGDPESNAEALDLGIPTISIDPWFYPWLLDLDALTDWPLSPSESRVLDAFEQLVTGQKSSSTLVPRLPMVIPQLMRSLKDDTMTGAQLARQIAKDPVLVGEVIRVANSPYYRRAHKISSIEQAVLILGRDGLHQIIARVAFYPIFNLKSGHFTNLAAGRVWTQSERCALVCHCLAEHRDQDVFSAYLAGLVANVGLMVGFRLMDQVLASPRDLIPNSRAFYAVFIERSRQTSHRIIKEWDFPEGIIRAIDEQANPEPNAARSWLGAILAIADQYAKLSLLVEKRCLPEDELDTQPLMSEPCYRRLLLDGSS
ncbi:HDOD domain-containing protein [Thermochromatium tepidum]|uniref:HDOD domain-containing protein n=1 Tax=Thermochromatium tepidum ATCC 43061 TaxID=316276 RepID=A0A6I6E1B8_THETI|nr:HDOD domain-containing protein [Thermochromatium tepidum]QGU32725.1 HDOD domain-containing protein [Thermochromatium tepidum ATCC 43061]